MSLSYKTAHTVSQKDVTTRPQKELFLELERAGSNPGSAICPLCDSLATGLFHVLSQDLAALPLDPRGKH